MFYQTQKPVMFETCRSFSDKVKKVRKLRNIFKMFMIVPGGHQIVLFETEESGMVIIS